MRRGWVRPAVVLLLVAAGILAARALGLGDLIRLENVARLKQGIEGYGALAPAAYIAGYILAVVFFVPGLPITVLGGVAFGPLWGTFYVWIAATIGARLAFLVARYGVRGMVERWVQASPCIAKMDGQVAEHGWRIVMLTRLVPIFPFNLQNHAYGLTRIGFWPYAITSSIQYPTKSIKDGGSLLSPIWKKKVATVARTVYSLDDIEHGVLRKAFREPRVHFAIACASLSCPDLPAEPYDPARLDAQLDQQAAAFLSNATKGLQPGADGRTARVSSIFKWSAGDFAASGGVAAFIRARSSPGVAARLGALTDAGLSYLDYDWSLNDTARSP